MGFGQPPIAGTNLVRDAINSPNFIHLIQGWSVNRDGTAEFQNVIIRGTITASDFRSSNYVAGVSGFDLNAITNVAEFNTGFRVGPAVGSHVSIAVNLVQGNAGIVMSTGDPTETVPAQIGVFDPANQPTLEFVSPNVGNGVTFMNVQAASSTLLGGMLVSSTSPPIVGNANISAVLASDTNVQGRMQATGPVSGIEFALLTGVAAGTHLRYSGSEIQAVTGGSTTAPLSLNPAGSFTTMINARVTSTNAIAGGSMALLTGDVAGTHVRYSGSEIQAITGGSTAGPLSLNPSGSFVTMINERVTSTSSVASGTMALITGAAAGTHLRYSGSEIQAVTGGSTNDTLALNPGGGAVTAPTMRAASAAVSATSASITSTSFVDFATLSVSFVAPASGTVYVDARALMQITNSAATFMRALMAFAVRNTNGSGTLFRAASDREAVDFGVGAGLAGRLQAATTGVVTGLTPGNTYAVNMAVRTTDAGGTTSVSLFDCNVVIIPSL